MKYITLFLIILVMACKNQVKTETKSDAKQYNIEVIQPLEKLASEFKFTEGPAVDNQGNVYFSDIPDSKIWIWSTADSLKLYRANSFGSNGLYFGPDQNLLTCESQKSRITLTKPSGDYKILASQFQGKPFNQTNDLWADQNGGIYFTDPQYGGDLENLPQGGMHVYYITPDKKLRRVCDDLTRPNGIIGTPDGKNLYVSDRGSGETFRYTIQNDGTLTNKTLFIDLGSDGMTIDQKGNVYITTKDKSQVDIFSKNGQHLKTIKVPEAPTNLCFGGINRNQLFITARTSLYRVALNMKGVD